MSKQVHYKIHGDGRPILILHGGYLDHRHMVDAIEPVFEQIAGWRRVYIDLPGHGHSKVDASIDNNDNVLDIILNFMDDIAPGEQYALIGESRGGYLARGIVFKRSESVRGAMFIVPGRYAVPREGSVPVHKTLVRADDLVPTLAEHEVSRFDRLVVQNQEILEKIRSTKIPATELADKGHLKGIDENYEFSFDVDSPAQPFLKPSLFLLGRQDTMVGYRDAWQAIENFPRATFAILDKAGHSLSWEQPHLFVALAREWLNRIKEFDDNVS
ncbi:alpha/beta hydrolase [Gammaproteobacteria bacterium]|nr:alpha/beta hydrolase [Gammaproteobacteria bacterium]